jgi:hypothetical protein
MIIGNAYCFFSPKTSIILYFKFEHIRAFPINAEQNKETAKAKITTSVLALGGDIYPALGGDLPGNFAYSSLQSLASNVTGVTHFQDIGFQKSNQNL